MNGLAVLILAAESGVKQTRWAESAVPKQLIQVRGEALLARTLRLLAERGVQAPWLLTASEALASYPVPSWCPLQRETKAHSLLAAEAVTAAGDLLVLYSDVYYSEAAIDTILASQGTRFYGRDGRSAYTFKDYGELFAVRIADTDRGRARDALERAIRFYQDTGNQSFWSFYRLMAGLPLSDSKAIERRVFVNIHDETDDVDFVEEVPLLLAAIDKPLSWRLRHLVRRLSLANKRRRDRTRGLSGGALEAV
ncbi:NTP transferase domain-containing protein [Ectopseudomonas guguanensis]|uniref:NTP transferase domain-containing protein n=1 Tax=Ectopseudomonas guguanensis TaxID=1198456 RepID=UPI0028ACD3C9|nr:NTP transferase domain-containing protein [Pseudomonas guguanensis]